MISFQTKSIHFKYSIFIIVLKSTNPSSNIPNPTVNNPERQYKAHDISPVCSKLFSRIVYFYYFLFLLLFTLSLPVSPVLLILLLHHYECDLVSACLSLVPFNCLSIQLFIFILVRQSNQLKTTQNKKLSN